MKVCPRLHSKTKRSEKRKRPKKPLRQQINLLARRRRRRRAYWKSSLPINEALVDAERTVVLDEDKVGTAAKKAWTGVAIAKTVVSGFLQLPISHQSNAEEVLKAEKDNKEGMDVVAHETLARTSWQLQPVQTRPRPVQALDDNEEKRKAVVLTAMVQRLLPPVDCHRKSPTAPLRPPPAKSSPHRQQSKQTAVYPQPQPQAWAAHLHDRSQQSPRH